MLLLLKARPTPAQAEAGNYKKPRRQWKGLEIAIENPVGSVREGKGWRTVMKNAYGYVCRSEGVDGDEVDVYLGPELDDAPMVYVVHQRKAGDWKAYDEDKVMLGFSSEAAARAAYLAHYDDPRFLGPITTMTAGDFINKVRATKDKPAMIKAVFLKSHVQGYTRKNGSYVPPHEDSRTRSAPPPAHDDFEDDMTAQMAWLTERAKEEGFMDVDDLLERDPALFSRMATGWREAHPMLAKALDQLAGRGMPASMIKSILFLKALP